MILVVILMLLMAACLKAGSFAELLHVITLHLLMLPCPIGTLPELGRGGEVLRLCPSIVIG